MSTETPDEDPDLPPTPVPDVIAYAWLSFLEGIIAAGIVVFSIALLEAGELIPDVLAELSVGIGTLVVVTAVLFLLRVRK